jgi:hypothetical protein
MTKKYQKIAEMPQNNQYIIENDQYIIENDQYIIENDQYLIENDKTLLGMTRKACCGLK